MNFKLEVIIIPVSDVDRARKFYENLGWRLDGDFVANEKLRVVQFTPPRSEASIIFGKGIASARSGLTDGLVLAVESVDASRADLVERGVKVGEVFHYADLPFNNSVHNPRISGRDPEDRSYFTFASFEGPDGNGWLLQEVTTRLPGREWDEAGSMDVATLAALLHETSERHDQFEKTHAEHHWWDWYASYLNARQNGNSSDKPTAIWRRSSMFLRDNVARLSLREFYRKLVLGSWELIRVKTVAALPSSKRPGASCESENQAQS